MKQSEARAFIESKASVNDSGCWIWPQPGRRYGITKIGGKFYSAHRLSYMAYKGRIGKGNEVCHTCDVTLCVNPEHLFVGTHKSNMKDMAAKDRSGVRELNNYRGKYTDDQVREMREKYARGIPISWIAQEFGSSAVYVRRIVRRQTNGEGQVPRWHA